MPQGEHMDLHRKRQGQRFDFQERKRKREAREVHKRAAFAQKALGLKGKLYAKKRHAEKASMRKTIAMHQEHDNKHKADDGAASGAVPVYLLEREQVSGTSGSCALLLAPLAAAAMLGHALPLAVEPVLGLHLHMTKQLCMYGSYTLTWPLLSVQVQRAKVLSNTIKQKRKEKAGKWEVPLPKVSRHGKLTGSSSS